MGNICRNGDGKNQHIADGMDSVANDINGYELDNRVEHVCMMMR